ncbi:DUF5988 family protein [Amycolatopsis sp. lyj-112]|uniref:DUF5988 family protein n=1 Tax=Amycolatopsis sp. lyj-112 TaxID=2789288 RepID=UPI00397D6DBA
MMPIKIDPTGSRALPSDLETRLKVEDLTEDLKICVNGGYEHFSHAGEFQKVDDVNVAVFRWSGRTKIAE